MKPVRKTWWQLPEQYLFAYDLARDTARFICLDRAALARSSFLDQRIAGDVASAHEAPLAELIADPVNNSLPDPGYIFHTAFCCSTLLARSLDRPGRTLVLREPASLLQLADLDRGLTAATRGLDELSPLTTALLARPFPGETRVIVKPTNLANNLVGRLLEQAPDSRAVVLYDELEPFLLSVLKRPSESEEGIAQFLRRLLRADLSWPAGRPLPSELSERAALAWALQMRELRKWLTSPIALRIRTLTAPELLADPPFALSAVADWLQIDLPQSEAEAIVRSDLWRQHAKHPDKTYSPTRRQTDQTLARSILSPSVSRAMAWAAVELREESSALPGGCRLLT